MKLQIRHLMTLEMHSASGALLVSHLILLLRCALLSIFIYVVALNAWKPFPFDGLIRGAARIVAYPVYLLETPFLNNFQFAMYFGRVPVGLGFESPGIIPKVTSLRADTKNHPGFELNGTLFPHPDFLFNIFLYTSFYFSTVLGLRKLKRKLWPNP